MPTVRAERFGPQGVEGLSEAPDDLDALMRRERAKQRAAGPRGSHFVGAGRLLSEVFQGERKTLNKTAHRVHAR
jgi:hypothetical protein